MPMLNINPHAIYFHLDKFDLFIYLRRKNVHIYTHTHTKKKKEISTLKHAQLKKTKLVQNIDNNTIYTISQMTSMT